MTYDIIYLATNAGIPFNKYGLVGCHCCEQAINDGNEIRKLREANAELTQKIDRLIGALQTIERWGSHTSDLSVEYGSNGVRDFYRTIARAASAGIS